MYDIKDLIMPAEFAQKTAPTIRVGYEVESRQGEDKGVRYVVTGLYNSVFTVRRRAICGEGYIRTSFSRNQLVDKTVVVVRPK